MKNFLIFLTLTASLPAAFAGYDGNKFDRLLSEQETRKLLPLYVEMVERQAATLPSATENQILASLAYGVTNPTYYAFDENNKVVGRQSHTAESLRGEIESALAELKEITPEQRIREAGELLAGFKSPRAAGRISCRLGYEDGVKTPTGRIVKCDDDHSQKGRGEDEGYYDVRTFILSIDAATLKPVSTLRLEHPIAG